MGIITTDTTSRESVSKALGGLASTVGNILKKVKEHRTVDAQGLPRSQSTSSRMMDNFPDFLNMSIATFLTIPTDVDGW